jgi:hypothetical protein
MTATGPVPAAGDPGQIASVDQVRPLSVVVDEPIAPLAVVKKTVIIPEFESR